MVILLVVGMFKVLLAGQASAARRPASERILVALVKVRWSLSD
ncbi:hypothetical protein [Paraburkholderia rhizosphaerae]|nr:hypothetical protein [Paraburkholderia rhizosphaerae]